MRSASWLLAISIIAAQAVVVPSPLSAAAHETVYSSAESDFVIGKTVYLRSSKMRIGRILAVDANHGFPRTFAHPRMKAVLIQHTDGPRSWTPVEGITRIYVVNK